MFYFFHVLGRIIIPTDELIFFRGVGQPLTRFGKSPCLMGNQRTKSPCSIAMFRFYGLFNNSGGGMSLIQPSSNFLRKMRWASGCGDRRQHIPLCR